MPEEIMQALAEDSGSDDKKSPASDSEDSSDSSSFAGVSRAKQEPEVPASANKKQSAKGKAKANAKKRSGKTEATQAPSAVKDKADKAADKADKERKKEEDRIGNLVATHQKTLGLLQELTPNVVWRSLVRTVELDRRLTKAAAALDELSALSDPDTPEPLREQISTLKIDLAKSIAFAQSLKATCLFVRTTGSAEMSKEVLEGKELVSSIQKCCTSLLSDSATIADMLHSIAKKLFEARCAFHRFQFPVVVCEMGWAELDSIGSLLYSEFSLVVPASQKPTFDNLPR